MNTRALWLAAGVTAALATACGAAWHFAKKSEDAERRHWLGRLFPVAGETPAAIRPSGAQPGAKVCWLAGDERASGLWRSLEGPGLIWENIANSGYTTLDTRDRLRFYLSTAGHPDAVVIQCGLADLQACAAAPADRRRILDAAKERLNHIALEAAAQDRELKLIFTTIIPRGEMSWPEAWKLKWTPELDAAAEELNHAIRNLAGPKITVVDAAAALDTERLLRDADRLDGLHLNDNGNRKLAAAVTAAVAAALR